MPFVAVIIKTQVDGDVVAKIVGADGLTKLVIGASGAEVNVKALPSGSMAAVTAKTFDFDLAGGVDTVAMLGLALPKNGGAVAGGTSTDPVRTDPTGTTAQPITDNAGSITVDGTVTANAGSGTYGTNISQYGGTSTTLGQKAMSASVPVVISSDQSSLPISGFAPTSPKKSHAEATGIAAAAQTILKSSVVTASTTGKLVAILVSGTVQFEAELCLTDDDGSSLTIYSVLYASAANPHIVWSLPLGFITEAGGTGHKFAVRCTNKDSSDVGDFAATFLWDEV